VTGANPSPQAHAYAYACVSMYACPNAKTMRRCKPSGVSWQRQRELDPRRGPWQVQPHHMRSHTSAVHTHCARMGPPIYKSRAAQVSMRTMPLNSTHTHTQTIMPAILSPDAQVYYYHIIMVLWQYYLRLWPRARPHVVSLCRCAPYSRVQHAAGNHSSSAMSSTSMLSGSHKYSRCIA